MGFDYDAGTYVACSDHVDPHGSKESERRPFTHCQAAPETAGTDGSCVQRDIFWPAVHETPTVVAQDQWVLPEGKPASHAQGHAALPSCLRHVEETLVLISGLGAGSSWSPRMLVTDASLTGWGGVMSGRSARGLWSGHHLTWHINCLELLAVFLALKPFLPNLRDCHVLVCTGNTAVVSYINHQRGLRSRPLYRLVHQILVWSQGKLLSLRTVHIPGHLKMGADILSRQGPRPGEWRLHQAQVDLFATREVTHCPLWFSLTHPAPRGLDALVQIWLRLRLYTFPRSLCSREFCRECAGWAKEPRSGRPSMLGPDFPSQRLSVEISVRRDLLSQAEGTIFHPCSERWELWM